MWTRLVDVPIGTQINHEFRGEWWTLEGRLFRDTNFYKVGHEDKTKSYIILQLFP